MRISSPEPRTSRQDVLPPKPRFSLWGVGVEPRTPQNFTRRRDASCGERIKAHHTPKAAWRKSENAGYRQIFFGGAGQEWHRAPSLLRGKVLDMMLNPCRHSANASEW